MTNQEIIKKITKMGFSAQEHNGVVLISAENGDGAAEYYHHTGMYVNPKLEALANSLGGFIDWQDTGTIFICY